MFDFIKNWLNRKKKKRQEYKSLQLNDDANSLIQVKEHNQELWLTYNCHLVCPMDMFKGETIDVICKIRSLYIKRNSANKCKPFC